MRPTSLLLPILMALPTITLAQTRLLEAVVIDAENKEPVSYATIIYPDQQYGFSANENGYFKIKMALVERSKRITISSIGYEQYESTLGEMVDQNIDTVILRPKVIMLKEVLVKAESETPKDMIEKSAKYLQDFLGKEPYYLFVNYSEAIKKNNQFVGFTEAQGMMHVPGYQSGYNRKNELFAYDLAQWKNLRRTYYRVPSECDREKKRTLAINKLTRAKSKYLYEGPFNKVSHNDFSYTFDSLTNFNDTDVFIISFSPVDEKHTFGGKAYIKVDDYALIGLEVTEQNAQTTLYDNCSVKPKTNFRLRYTKVGNRYYFKSSELVITYRWNNAEIKETIRLYGEEFSKNETVDLNYDQRMVIFNEMINPSVPFDNTFWSESKLPSNLTDDLGANMSLEKQFFANSGIRPIPLPDQMKDYEELYKNQDLFRLFVNQEF